MPLEQDNTAPETPGTPETGAAQAADTNTVASTEASVQEPQTLADAITQGLSELDESGNQAAKPDNQEAKAADESAAAEAAAKEQPADDKGKKPAVEDDPYRMPEGLKPESQQRFQRLVDSNKTLTAQAQQLDADLQGFREIITTSQATPEEFMQLIDYSRAVKTGDFDGALRMLDQQRAALSIAMGRPLEGTNALADYPDLAAEVADFKLTQERALEIARGRRQTANAEARRTEEAPRVQYQQEKANALSNIEKLGNEWATKDIDYAHKEAIILKRLPSIAQNSHPSTWAAQITMLYESLGDVSFAPPPAPNKDAQPLRPSGSRGGNQVPTNMQDAIAQGLGYNS